MGKTIFFLLKKPLMFFFWGGHAFHKKGESIFEGIFRFWQKNSKNWQRKAGTMELGTTECWNDRIKERRNEGTTLNEEWGNADTTSALFKNLVKNHPVSGDGCPGLARNFLLKERRAGLKIPNSLRRSSSSGLWTREGGVIVTEFTFRVHFVRYLSMVFTPSFFVLRPEECHTKIKMELLQRYCFRGFLDQR